VPSTLRTEVEEILRQQPSLPWDVALLQVARQHHTTADER
jgi:hypothetical protein